MKILIAHNTYQQRGGEDMVFEQESAMLAATGYDVRRFMVHNDHIHGLAGKIAAARSVIINKSSVAALCAEVDAFRPDVVHFLNFFCRPGNSLSLRASLHSLEEKELTFLGPSSAGAGSDSNSAKKAAMQKTKKKKFQKWNRPRFKRDKPQTNILFGDLLSRHFTTLIFFALKRHQRGGVLNQGTGTAVPVRNRRKEGKGGFWFDFGPEENQSIKKVNNQRDRFIYEGMYGERRDGTKARHNETFYKPKISSSTSSIFLRCAAMMLLSTLDDRPQSSWLRWSVKRV